MLSSSSSPFSAAPPLIIECKDTSERIDLCEAHVSEPFFLLIFV